MCLDLGTEVWQIVRQRHTGMLQTVLNLSLELRAGSPSCQLFQGLV